MSLYIATGFDNALYDHRFNVAGSMASGGRFGRGRYIRLANGDHYCDLPLLPGEEYDSWVIGYACREDTSPYVDLAYSSSFLELFGDGGQPHLQIYWHRVSANNLVIRVRNGNGTLLQDSAPIPITYAVWRYMEFKFNIHDSTGSVEVRRDGVTLINVSGVSTRNGGTTANIHTIRFGQNAENSIGSLDDIYVLKNDGVGLTDFLGEVEVEGIYPTGNGTYSQMTGSDGDSTDNYLHVDDNTGVNDADYVGSSVDGDKDTYAMSEIIRTNASVDGVILAHRSRKSDTNLKSVRRVLRSNGTDDVGADIALPSSFLWNHEVFENNPVTGTSWTVGDVNDLEAGTEVRP